jgi:hypothetical protein
LANFQEYDREEKALTYVRDAASKPEQLIQIAIFPFAFAGEAGTGSIVRVSKRATAEAGASAVTAVANHAVVDLEDHSYRRRFIPAKATVFNGTGNYGEGTSQITGVKYAKRGGTSYTIPYGASAGDPAEGQVRKKILTAVSTDSKNSVSFKSERV